MGTVSGHQLSTFSSPVNGTSPIDANTVRGNDNTIKASYNAHDADVTIHLQSGAVASRPAASTANQTWLATDTGAVYLYLDTGSAWVEANYLRNTGGTVSGAVTFNGGATVASGQTLTLTGATVAGAPTWNSTQSLNTSGNAATATALQTGRTINGVTFDGTANITVTAAAGTLTGTTLNATVVSSSLTSVGTLTSLTVANGLTVSANGITVVAGSSSFGGSVSATSLTASSAANVGAGFRQTTTFSLANNATTTIPGMSYGFLYVADSSATGDGALVGIPVGGATTQILMNGGSLFSATAGNVGTINVYFNAGALTIQNKTGADITGMRVIALSAG